MDDIAAKVHVVDSTYGLEAACVPFGTWFEFIDGQDELRRETIELDRPDQVVLYFPLITDRDVTEADVLEACALKLYGHAAPTAFARVHLAAPRADVREPVAIAQRDGDRPASAVVTLKFEGGMHDFWAGALEFGPMCMASDVRDALLTATTVGVPVHTLTDVVYIANIDGFQALSKASSAGTGEFQMATTFAVKLLTRANSKSTHFVLPVCLFPGDDNYNNWLHVMRADKIDVQMDAACRVPKPDPLHPTTNSIVHCNLGWAIDSKAASNQIGQGAWISRFANPCGRCLCPRTTIVDASAAEALARCSENTRSDNLAQARLQVAAGNNMGEQTELLNGKLGDLAHHVHVFSTRTGSLMRTMYHAITRMPIAFGAIENAARSQHADPSQRATVLTGLRLAEAQLRPFLKDGRIEEGGKQVVPLPSHQVGSADPLKQLKCCVTALHGSLTEAIAEGEREAGTPLFAQQVDSLSRHACTARLETAKVAEYWKSSKVGGSARLNPGGPVAVLMRFLQGLKPLLADADAYVGDDPRWLEGTTVESLRQAAKESVSIIEHALTEQSTNPNLQAQIALRKVIEERFHKRGSSLVSDKSLAVIAQELGVDHSCDTLPGGRLPCALRIGALHAGPLRSIQGVGINKVILGNAHAVKKTATRPPLGSYKPADEAIDLNKGHLSGGETTQSCVVNMLDSKRMQTKTIPNTAGSRQQLKQPDGSDVELLLGSLTIRDPISGGYLLPQVLPLWECFPPLLRDGVRAMLYLMAALMALTYAEEPQSQFGSEWTCSRLSDFAENASAALKKVLRALHPRFKTRRGHYINVVVLSLHLWLDHLMTQDFRRFCGGLVTLGRLIEDAFETMHIFSKGAIHRGVAPPKDGYNRMSFALRRLTRMVTASLRRIDVPRKRRIAFTEQWRQTTAGRAHWLALGQSAMDWLERCAEDKASRFDVTAGKLVAADGRCASHPLFAPGSMAAPILTLDGSSAGEGGVTGEGGAEDDDEEEQQLDETAGGEADGEQADGQEPGAPEPVEEELCPANAHLESPDGETHGVEQEELAAENAHAINDEDGEFTRTDERALETLREEGCGCTTSSKCPVSCALHSARLPGMHLIIAL